MPRRRELAIWLAAAGLATAGTLAGLSLGPVPPSVGEPRPMAAARVRQLRAVSENERETDWLTIPGGVWDLGVHDMNGDRRRDLVIVTGGPQSTSGSVVLLFNPPRRAELADWERFQLPGAGDYGRVAVADIDGDGVEDVAALTFDTQILRWWRLGADHSVLDQRSMSFGGTELPGRTCPGPVPLPQRRLTLSSLALADLDVDGRIELAVGAYASGREGGIFSFSFDRESGCFQLQAGVSGPSRGSLRLRFFDLDDDGSLDLLASHYALTRARAGAASSCADCLEWGQWWPRSAGRPQPLEARFGNRALGAAEPTPELNVVDFDVLRTPSGVRYALAGSAHLCPAQDCWSVGRAGFLGVFDESGRELDSRDAWRQQLERDPPIEGARLLPRAVSFGGVLDDPSLSAAYWWATRQKDTRCGRILPCAGPVTSGAVSSPGAMAQESAAFETVAFAQALAFVDAPGSAIEIRRGCQPLGSRLVPLPELEVAGILELRSGGRVLAPAEYAWVPGSRAINLAPAAAAEPTEICITYAASAEPPLLAVADSQRGLLLSARHDRQRIRERKGESHARDTARAHGNFAGQAR